MIGYQWNLDVKAYNITNRRQRRAYHIQMESIRDVNARIMRKNLRRVFRHQKEAIMGLDDPLDFNQVAIAVLSTNDELRNVFAYTYQRVARDVYPMLTTTPKAKSFIQMEMKGQDPSKQYYDVVLAQWVNDNLGEKIVQVQQTTLNQLRKSYALLTQGEATAFANQGIDMGNAFNRNALQSSFRDEVIKAFEKTYDTNISVFRANCIARTECHAATTASSLAVTREIGGCTGKEWMAVGDMDTRDSHQFMDGKVIGIDELFNVDGSLMDGPGDSTHGADVKEIANCRCDLGYHYD